jgi:hypothetical protein
VSKLRRPWSDPFLIADSTRLQNSFETLHDPADDGWQIVCLNSKQKLQDRMANELSCDEYEPEVLDY